MNDVELPGETAAAPSAVAARAAQVVLEERLNVIAGHLNAQHAQLVDVTVELLAAPGRWRGDGVWTAAQYLCWRVGLSPHRARQVVAIAERVDELPVCVAAFRRGELTVDAMAVIAGRAPWWTDRQAARYGQTMTITQLRRVLAQYPFPDIRHPDDHSEEAGDSDASDCGETGVDGSSGDTSAPDEPTSTVERDSWLRFGWNDQGRFHFSGATDAATGLLIETALVEARDRLFQDRQSEVGWLDALRETCHRSVDAVGEPARRDRFRINLHLDIDGICTDAVGTRLPDAIRRHLSCDGLLSPVFTADGVPLSVGRSQRIVPERTRRQVVHRDHGCRVPGCTARRFLEVHHIVHWLDHGPTDTWNLICLCPHHHRLHHQGRLGITGNAESPEGVVFTDAAGEPIAQTGTNPTPPAGPPPPPTGTFRHPLGERLHLDAVHFNPPPEHRQTA